MACLIKLWERVKLHMMISFFFSNNFSILPNDKTVGRCKLEAFAEEFKLKQELFSVMIGWETFFFFFNKGKLLLNCVFFFSLNVFSKPSVINWLRFLKFKAFLSAMFLRHSQAPNRKPPVKHYLPFDGMVIFGAHDLSRQCR